MSTILGPAQIPGTGHSVSADSVADLAKQLATIDLPKFHQEAKDRLDVAISKLITFSPVYGIVFMFLNKRQDRGLPTMGVGVIDRVNLALFYNPEFVMTLGTKELRAVLQHEALHVLLHHITRREHFDFNPKGFNIAADMAINCHLSNLPDKCFYPKTFGLEDYQSSEWYYDQLKEQAEKNGGNGISVHADGKGEMVGDHERWGECEGDIVKEKIRSIAETAIREQAKKGWSDIGEGIAAAIIEANKAQINWKREFRWFINKLIMAGRKSTRTRINRREHSIKKQRELKNPDDVFSKAYIQPGNKRDYTSKLMVAIDTSGSMSDEEISICLTEVKGMVEHVECHVCFFDCNMQGEPVHISKKFNSMEVRGRGGTNFDPVMRYVDEHKYDGLIIMTDGYAPFPEKPKARLLWAVTMQGEGVVFPYGKRVLLDIKKK